VDRFGNTAIYFAPPLIGFFRDGEVTGFFFAVGTVCSEGSKSDVLITACDPSLSLTAIVWTIAIVPAF
jgi:hypothetical protein